MPGSVRRSFGQTNLHVRAFAFFTLDDERAAVQLREPACDAQAQTESLLLMQLAVELHVGTNLFDLLGGKAAPEIADVQTEGFGCLHEFHSHAASSRGK